MAESNELNKIKKLYGEKFMHLCRDLFPTILEHEGVLLDVLKASFAGNSRTLGEDISKEGLEEFFKDYIFSKIGVEDEEPKIVENKTPYELLEEAGYDLYECTSEEEIQSFRKYYNSEEKLCTFRGRRLDKCIVFWAVKKNVDEIKREDFKEPKREDEYGTSVMSIQFSRGKISTVSIKNRYNHTVNNPDATYGNNLDKIIPGLTQSFTELLAERGMKLTASNIEDFEIPDYTVAQDGRYYKYNMELNGKYYCPGNIIIEFGDIVQLQSEKLVLIDYFILDKERKTLRIYDQSVSDFFQDFFSNNEIENIEMKKDDEKEKGLRRVTIYLKNHDVPVEVEIDKENNIIGYKNEELTKVTNDFLSHNIKLKQLELPNLIEVGDCFLDVNEGLNRLSLPKLTKTGNFFLYFNEKLSQLELPNLTQTGDGFLFANSQLKQLDLPKLTRVGTEFLYHNRNLEQLNLPSLRVTGDYFLYTNEGLSQLDLQSLKVAGNLFLYRNENISQLQLPNLVQTGNLFLYCNEKLSQLQLPNLEEVGNLFLYYNKKLNQLKLPNLKKAGDCFLYNNKSLRRVELPKLWLIGRNYLPLNKPMQTRFTDILNINRSRMFSYIDDDIDDDIDEIDLAELDKESELTTTEIALGKSVIENIKGKENSQNEK